MSVYLPINNGDTGEVVAEKILNSHNLNAENIEQLDNRVENSETNITNLWNEINGVSDKVNWMSDTTDCTQSYYNNITPDPNKYYLITE